MGLQFLRYNFFMNFDKVEKSYNQNAVVQFEMAKKMATLIKKYCACPKRILEIGSGTGFLTNYIYNEFNSNCELFLNDINKNQTKIEIPPQNFIQGDILDVEIPNNIDLITSNAVFQWINPNKLFKKLYQHINNNSTIAFSTFGKENYKQFKNFGGINYLTINELECILKENSLEVVHLEEQIFTLYFNTPYEVLKHIKSTGVTTFNNEKNAKLWTKSTITNFEQKYLQENSDNNGISLTYHPIFCICNKM